MSCRRLLFALLLAALHVYATDQKCAVGGTASDATTGEALRKVTVELAPLSGATASYRTTTDASGRFSFTAVVPGDYWLHGERAGYLDTALGRQRSRTKGTFLRLQADETLADVRLKLVRAPVISGKVTDDSGEPVAEVLVGVYQAAWFNGHREFLPSGQGHTNDAGEYRITAWTSGRYYVHASAQQGPYVEEQGQPEKRLVPAFYPDADTLSSAMLVDGSASQDIAGINFRLHTAETYYARGKITKSSNGNANLSVAAVRDGTGGQSRTWEAGGSEIGRDGTFEIGGLASGTYQLLVVSSDPNSSARGNLRVELKGSDVNGIVIPVLGPVELSGTIHFEEGAIRIMGAALALIDAETGFSSDNFGLIEQDGTFRAKVLPGKYVISFPNVPDPDYVKSISYGGQEVLGQAIDLSQSVSGTVDITIAKGAGRVDGNLTAKEMMGGMEVALVSDQARFDGTGTLLAEVDQSGRFAFKGVPPGKYYAFATQDLDTGLWQNRDFFEQLRGQGVEVRVAENGSLQIQVALLPASEAERALAAIGQ